MSQRSERAELDLLSTVADGYRLQGFRVNVQPDPDSLPGELQGFKVDLLATRANETVIVEVKRGATGRDVSQQLDQLTAFARSLGWRVDLVSEPEPEGAVWPRTRRDALLTDALDLLRTDHKEAAILLACSALEGALREIVRKHRILPDRPVPVRQLIASLQSNGIIGPTMSERLFRLSDARNHAAHAMSMGRLPASEARSLIEVALWLNNSDFLTPDDMADWFFAHFEDPAEWVPYETSEGGYQYPHGEPHDATDVLMDEFSSAPDAAIEDAVHLIERLGTEWVRIR